MDRMNWVEKKERRIEGREKNKDRRLERGLNWGEKFWEKELMDNETNELSLQIHFHFFFFLSPPIFLYSLSSISSHSTTFFSFAVNRKNLESRIERERESLKFVSSRWLLLLTLKREWNLLFPNMVMCSQFDKIKMNEEMYWEGRKCQESKSS